MSRHSSADGKACDPTPDFPGLLMASDTMPGMPFTQGNNIWVNVECDGVPEIEALFKAFSEGGKVIMPLADQCWGARFGMLTDKFGINGMFNCELPKKNWIATSDFEM
jgi:PhnB protein